MDAPSIPGDDISVSPEEEQQFNDLLTKAAKRHEAQQEQKVYTPPPVTDYRVLSQYEVDLMNLIKAHGQALESLGLTVTGYLLNQRRGAARLEPITAMDAELRRLDKAQADRWAAIARTHFQEGLMALTRAVAQPSNF